MADKTAPLGKSHHALPLCFPLEIIRSLKPFVKGYFRKSLSGLQGCRPPLLSVAIPREIRYTQENYAESLAQAQALRSQGTPVILTPEEMVPEDKAPEGAAHEGKAPEGVTHEGKTPEEAASVSQAAGTGAESKEPVAPYPVCRCDSMPVREEGVK